MAGNSLGIGCTGGSRGWTRRWRWRGRSGGRPGTQCLGDGVALAVEEVGVPVEWALVLGLESLKAGPQRGSWSGAERG